MNTNGPLSQPLGLPTLFKHTTNLQHRGRSTIAASGCSGWDIYGEPNEFYEIGRIIRYSPRQTRPQPQSHVHQTLQVYRTIVDVLGSEMYW